MSLVDDIVDLLLSGMPQREIAEELGISGSTVNKYAHEAGLEYDKASKLWHQPATGRIETDAMTRILQFMKGTADVFTPYIFEPNQPKPTPTFPDIIQGDSFGFGVSDIAQGFNKYLPDGRQHMDLVIQVEFTPESGYDIFTHEMKAVQYLDGEIIRKMVLKRLPEIDKEDIARMVVWVDGEPGDEPDFDYGQDDFDLDDDEYPEE